MTVRNLPRGLACVWVWRWARTAVCLPFQTVRRRRRCRQRLRRSALWPWLVACRWLRCKTAVDCRTAHVWHGRFVWRFVRRWVGRRSTAQRNAWCRHARQQCCLGRVWSPSSRSRQVEEGTTPHCRRCRVVCPQAVRTFFCFRHFLLAFCRHACRRSSICTPLPPQRKVRHTTPPCCF